ncbi:PepSY-associated TM helix domain-containing protein [Nostoc sp. LPT]|uniref:PepSY-associated TM helix domain-containing protein n=1 Tax=Nostoc sp. LPT TaxID=2815387 RepID=UPI001DD18D2E|nr:PepSY-associated TM helix domain-containing protein [Nostoc sp. LPT]MBN4007082.1 PepSY domain-containing protein [Nostoc sp. LPT]
MSAKKLRHLTFVLHRILGFAIGLIAILVGLTGSLIVFQREINEFQLHQQFGAIFPKGDRFSLEVVLDIVKAAYVNQPEMALQRVYFPTKPDDFFNVVISIPGNDWVEVYVNPYTGAILGNSLHPNAVQHFLQIVYQLHTSLKLGDLGLQILGVVGLLMCIVVTTGIILWPGWRKLMAGFKIKWSAHPKRLNFDLHKVSGITTAIFLLLTFFTGFAWNLGDVDPLIRAITFSPSLPELLSVPLAGQSPLPLSQQIKTAQLALPDGALRSIDLTTDPKAPLRLRMKLPQEQLEYGMSNVYLDQYSGQVLRVENSLKASLGDKILNSFQPLHFGTFGGLPTRILYIFLGLAPLILFITGFVMWWYRYRAKPTTKNSI